MLAGEDLGRRHEGSLPSGFDHRRSRDQRHHGFAGADVALQQAQHALRASEIGDDVVDRLLLRMGERIRQRLEDARAQTPFAGRAAAGLPPHMRTHQRKRELPSEQLVIGKPRPRKTFRRDVVRLGRAVQIAQRGGEGGKALARDPRVVLPFRQIGQAGERAVHGAPHIAGGKAFGERIDRLDQRQVRKALLVYHAVGVHHLQHVVVQLNRAGDVAHLALGQKLTQVILARVEICERQRLPGVVAGDDTVGRARAVARRRPVLVDGDGDGHKLAGLHLIELRPRPAVDRAGGQVKQQVDDARRLAVEQPRIEPLQLRPDAGQAGEGSEQRAEHKRTHRLHHCKIFGVMPGLVPGIHVFLVND